MARTGQLLFSEELHGNCAALTITIKTHIDRLRELQKEAKKEADEPPVDTLEADPPSTPSSTRETGSKRSMCCWTPKAAIWSISPKSCRKRSPPAPTARKSDRPAARKTFEK